MSGIFGYLNLNNNLHVENAAGLAEWNRAHGTERRDAETCSGGNDSFKYSLGIFRETFKKKYLNNNSIQKCDGRISISDALLYRRSDESMENLSDEEYLDYVIEKKGINEIENENGDFAGAILNLKNRFLRLYRDHMGVRPLFYYYKDNLVIFSTDIRGITSIDFIDTSLNEDWVYDSIKYGGVLNIDQTEYKYIKCVPPGGYVDFTFSEDLLRECKNSYWVPGKKRYRFKDDEAYIKKHRELIEDAVRIRINAIDGEVGAELSGGLDSSVIDILINRFGRKCTFFSWSPSEEEISLVKDDERIIINDICTQEGIKCNYGKISMYTGKDSMIAQYTPLDITDRSMIEPVNIRYALPSYINTLEICETADYMKRSGVKAVFTGHGGDEGVSHRCNPYELFYNHEYYRYLKTMWARTYKSKNRIIDTLKLMFRNIKKQRVSYKNGFIAHNAIEQMMNKAFINSHANDKRKTLSFAYDPKSYIRNGGSRNRLDVVALFGAYNGVRYIAPYVDYRLIDYSLGIPRHLFVRGFQDRYIFRKAFEDLMPKSLYKLQTKDEKSLAAYWSKNSDKKKSNSTFGTESRQAVASLLDRELWGKFVDFEFLGKWVSEGEKLDVKDADIANMILTLYSAESMVKKSREYILK